MAGKFLIHDSLLRMRLLTAKQKEPYLLFYNLLGFYPRHIELYELALRHKSSSVRNDDGILLNNERLEFLGDAVLNLLVSDILFNQFKNQKEGFLSKTRAKIVRRESLNRIAAELGLNELTVTAQSLDTPHISIYGNALEALIGAIYTDQGYDRCKHFIEKKIISQFIDIQAVASSDVNYKSALLEWSQQHKADLTIQTDELANQGKKSFQFCARVLLNGTLIGEGCGFSKKEAHQQAAKKAMEEIKKHPEMAGAFRESVSDNPEIESSHLI